MTNILQIYFKLFEKIYFTTILCIDFENTKSFFQIAGKNGETDYQGTISGRARLTNKMRNRTKTVWEI